MKALTVTLGILAGLMFATHAVAADMPKLAKDKKCNSCHAIDAKVVGPAWKDVSKKYQGQKGAEKQLVAKIKNGGGGVWGPVAMPKQAVTDDEAKELVKFILGLAK